MEKWEKAIFWIIAVTIGVLLIGFLLKADFKGLIGAVVLIDILIILETVTKDMKSKWKAFGLRIAIMLVLVFLGGMILNVSPKIVAGLFWIIVLSDLIQTVTNKKSKVSKKN
jgi:predicted branched-subunit amino acid permease